MTSLEIILLVAVGLLLFSQFIWWGAYADMVDNLKLDRYNVEKEKEELQKVVDYFEENAPDIHSAVDIKLNVDKKVLEVKQTLYLNNEKRCEDNHEFDLVFSKKDLKFLLAEIELKEEYPLAYSIKHNDSDYIEIYINGKFKDKYTREYAWTWAKSYATKYDYKQNDNVYELNDKKEGEWW